jgi:lysophospholipase L1-like esterase
VPKRTVIIDTRIGPGVAPVEAAFKSFVRFSPVDTFKDGNAYSFNDDNEYTLENGGGTFTGLEDTYLLRPIVWRITIIIKSNNGGFEVSRHELLRIFPDGEDAVNLTDMLEVDETGKRVMPKPLVRTSGVLGVVGDSIPDDTDTPTTNSPKSRGNSFVNLIALHSMGKLYIPKNGAVSGTKTGEVLAGLDAYLAKYRPNIVLDQSGTNDARGRIALFTFQANKTAIHEKVRASGAKLVWGAVLPQGIPALPTPGAPGLEARTSGGSLPDGTYTYRVTAISGNNPRVEGETLASPPVSITVSGGAGAGSVLINLFITPGAAAHRVYRSINGGPEQMIRSVFSSYNSVPIRQFLDTSTATIGGASPTVNTTAIAADPITHQIIDQQNAWLAGYASKHDDITFLNFHAVLADPATGIFYAGYSYDAIHPSPKGHEAMAAYAQPFMEDLAVPQPDWTSRKQIANTNLMPNPLFLDTPLTNTWLMQGTPAGATMTAAPKAGFVGNALTLDATQRPTLSTATQINSVAITAASGAFTPGDKIRLGAMIQIEGNAGDAYVRIFVEDIDSGRIQDEQRISGLNLTRSVWQTEFQTSVSSARLVVRCQVYFGAAKVSIGQISLTNMTKLGLA